MHGPSINTPSDPSTHLSDPFNNANETKTAEVQFCVYAKSFLINKNQRVSGLPGRENEGSQNCNKAINSYNQVYADALLSRQLQDEEYNSLEQRGDALIKERELINNRRKSSLHSHCMQNLHKHQQSVQIGPSGYNSDTIKMQKHRRHYQTTSHEYCNAEQISLYHGGNSNPPSSHNNSSISGDSEVSYVYTCFVCGMDRHLSRFCLQMQSLADCGPDNYI